MVTFNISNANIINNVNELNDAIKVMINLSDFNIFTDLTNYTFN